MNSTPWGIVLASGDGTRLKALSRLLSGDDRPNQLCSMLGWNSLLRRAQEQPAHNLRLQFLRNVPCSLLRRPMSRSIGANSPILPRLSRGIEGQRPQSSMGSCG